MFLITERSSSKMARSRPRTHWIGKLDCEESRQKMKAIGTGRAREKRKKKFGRRHHCTS
jgi:hypothetical protein